MSEPSNYKDEYSRVFQPLFIVIICPLSPCQLWNLFSCSCNIRRWLISIILKFFWINSSFIDGTYYFDQFWSISSFIIFWIINFSFCFCIFLLIHHWKSSCAIWAIFRENLNKIFSWFPKWSISYIWKQSISVTIPSRKTSKENHHQSTKVFIIYFLLKIFDFLQTRSIWLLLSIIINTCNNFLLKLY